MYIYIYTTKKVILTRNQVFLSRMFVYLKAPTQSFQKNITFNKAG